jgi:hypothetical protein
LLHHFSYCFGFFHARAGGSIGETDADADSNTSSNSDAFAETSF